MKVAVRTFGCKLNQFESAALAESLSAAGYEVVPAVSEAELVVVNTCTVTSVGDAECRKYIRHLARRADPPMVVAVGCYVERDRKEVASLPGVKLVLGQEEKLSLARRLTAMIGASAGAVQDQGRFPLITSFGSRTRAFVKIQDGCDNRCAYCVVWQLRGPNRSQSEAGVARQVSALAKAGYREVVLTGVHLGSWGSDLGGDRCLADLLEHILDETDGIRVRLSSIEPNEFTPRLMEVVRNRPRICRHFHIPLQSGSDKVLAAMNRGYSAEEYGRLVQRIRRDLPEASLGADVIGGFPGESDDDFETTCRLIEELPLTYLHVFRYSRRPGTPAAAMPGQVPAAVSEERARRLRAMGSGKARRFQERHVGRDLSCLVESTRDPASGLLRGLTDNYLRVLTAGPDHLYNAMVRIRAEGIEGKYIKGTLLGEGEGRPS